MFTKNLLNLSAQGRVCNSAAIKIHTGDFIFVFLTFFGCKIDNFPGFFSYLIDIHRVGSQKIFASSQYSIIHVRYVLKFWMLTAVGYLMTILLSLILLRLEMGGLVSSFYQFCESFC
jgi:hypothetical protein